LAWVRESEKGIGLAPVQEWEKGIGLALVQEWEKGIGLAPVQETEKGTRWAKEKRVREKLPRMEWTLLVQAELLAQRELEEEQGVGVPVPSAE
jgi:hypothetical protein